MKKLTMTGLIMLAIATSASPLMRTLRATTAAAEEAAQAVVNLHVDGMHCVTCPITVRTVLQRLDGVSRVEVSAAGKSARVVYDPVRVTPARMAEAVTRAGYPARVNP